MTEKELQYCACVYFSNRSCVVAINSTAIWPGNEIDVFVLRNNGYTLELECKSTLADLKADFKKEAKHLALEKGSYVANRFAYLLSPDIDLEKALKFIPDYAGVYIPFYTTECNIWKLKEVMACKMLHKMRFGSHYEMMRSMTFSVLNSLPAPQPPQPPNQ